MKFLEKDDLIKCFLRLPDRQSREKVFEIYLNKYRPTFTKNFNISLLGGFNKGFSIEQVVIEAMRLALNESRDFNEEDVIASIQNLDPYIEN